MSRSLLCAVQVALLLTASAGASVRPPDPTITLSPSLPSPQMLGNSIKWTAVVQNGPPGHTYDYQFSAALPGQNQIVRDFSLNNSFVWVPWTVEGTYVVTVVVRDITQQPYQTFPPVSVQYELDPWVTNSGDSHVIPTPHPLVALFSAGPCTSGHFIRVRFQQNGSQVSSTTNAVPCSQKSANFLVAGMAPSAQYLMHWEEFSSNFQNSGPDLPFNSGPLPNHFPALHSTVLVPPTQHDAAYPIILWQVLPPVGQPFVGWPIATDLAGSTVWYYPGEVFMTRTEPGGYFFGMDDYNLQEFDLAGNQTLGTNPEILNEQLVAKGYPQMTSFNSHETKRLSNGNILVLGARDEPSEVYQGGTKGHPVDILGDMVLVLDHNLQLLWAWDSFAHQDLSRAATMGDICVHNTGAGCPIFSNDFQTANDWLHSNSVQLTSDGNLLLSERNQDWVIKINYANGQGDGSILWKMGPYGDFTITNPPQTQCGDPAVYPWFTHQHDAAFQTAFGALRPFTVFDDGNLRVKQCQGGNSRGMVLYVAEAARTVTIGTQADLGSFSGALGSAQLMISPGNYYASFGNGLINFQPKAQATEVDASGKIVYELQVDKGSYRSYRMQDLYTTAIP